MRIRSFFPLILLALTLTVACQQPETDPVSPKEDARTLLAATEPSSTTKTLLEGLEVKWSEFDLIRVFENQGGRAVNSHYYLQEGAGTTLGSFSFANIDEWLDFTLPDGIFAFYPEYRARQITSDGTIGCYFPETQNYSTELLNVLPMAGYGPDGDVLRFFNCCGIVRIRLTGEACIEQVRLSGNNGEVLSGEALVRVDGTGCSVRMGDDGSRSIVMKGNGVQLKPEEATEFNFILPPVRFDKGFTVEIYSTDWGVMTLRTSQSVDIPRNYIQPMDPVVFKAETTLPNQEAIADPVVLACCLEQCDFDGDGTLSVGEVLSVERINLNYQPVESLEGLEIFPNLTRLEMRCNYQYIPGYVTFYADGSIVSTPAECISECRLSSLDLSLTPRLTYLNITGCGFSEVDFSAAPHLQQLFASFNAFESPDLSELTELEHLDFGYNKLSAINLQANRKLRYLEVPENRLTDLDISQMENIHTVDYSRNTSIPHWDIPASLVSLNFWGVPVLDSVFRAPVGSCLQSFSCGASCLTDLDLREATHLNSVTCGGNRFQLLDLSRQTELLYIDLISGSSVSVDGQGNVIYDSSLRYIILPEGMTPGDIRWLNSHDGVEYYSGEFLYAPSNLEYLPAQGETLEITLYATEGIGQVETPEWLSYLEAEEITCSQWLLRFSCGPNTQHAAREGDIVIRGCGKETTVHVIQPSLVDPGSLSWDQIRFHHRSLLLRFTADWCTYCPAMSRQEAIAVAQIPEKLIRLYMHGGGSALYTAEADPLINRFGVSSLPTGLLDNRKQYLSSADIIGGVAETEENYPTQTGISWESWFGGDRLSLNLSLFIKEPGQYRVFAYAVENHIIGRQVDGDIEIPDYEHNYVVRKAFTNPAGDAFAVDEANTIHGFTYSIVLDSRWVRDNMDIVVFVEKTYGSRPVLGYGNADSYYVDNSVVGKAGVPLPLNAVASPSSGNENVVPGGKIIMH